MIEYMTVAEAAKLWGYSEAQVKRFCATGRISAEKRGKIWRIPKDTPRPEKTPRAKQEPKHGEPVRQEAGGEYGSVKFQQWFKEQMGAGLSAPYAPFVGMIRGKGYKLPEEGGERD